MSAFGLLGKQISYSFSKSYFEDKFLELQLNHTYSNFDVNTLDEFISEYKSIDNLKGFNVTIPYKEDIIPHLDAIDEDAKAIGAVNTVLIEDQKLKGYNTDYIGFVKALKPLLKPHHKKALILGTGGASKAVAFGLEQLDIEYTLASRHPRDQQIGYSLIDDYMFETHHIVINTTPLGTHPNIDEAPILPYHYFTTQHIAFDLIYNPAETSFLLQAKQSGAIILNGEDMLKYQADEAWNIWNKG